MKRIMLGLLGLMICAGLVQGAVLLETGFEEYQTLPFGWTESQVSGSAAWSIQKGAYGNHPMSAYGGSFNATLFQFSGADNKTRLISPVFWSAAYTNLSLTFWHTQQAWDTSQDQLKVFYSADGGTNWSELAYYTNTIASWTKRTITLPTPSASSRIAFEGNAKYGYGVCLDDVQVTGVATVSLPVVSVTATDASAAEAGADTGSWTIVRTGNTNVSVTVNFSLSGTAVQTNDYILSHTGSVTFASGVTSVVVTMTPVNDTVYDELDETATLRLSPAGAGYEIGAAAGTITIADNDVSELQVLIIGSTKDSSERLGGSSVPFPPAAIAQQLDSILDAAVPGKANVVVRERYSKGVSCLGQTSYAYNLAGWFHWPYPSGAASNRWADLRGEAGNAWDYVILIPDPYTIEYTPGMYVQGVAEIANEVAKGSAETILLMSWPMGSHSSVAHYQEMIYRAGRSGSYKVAPAGLAWNTQGKPTGNNAAYLAAATIYSTIYGQNAKDTGYPYSPSSLADAAYTTVINNLDAKPYSGDITFQNPYLFRTDTKRKIYFSSRGSSTEAYFKDAAIRALGRCKIGVESYCPWNRSIADWEANGGDEPWTKWPTNWPVPIAWNDGRDGITSEWYKSYLVNSNYWDFGYGYYYHWGAWGETLEDANAHFIGQMFINDNDLANRMLSQGNSARNMPVRTIWASIYKEFPDEHPQMDDSHLNLIESDAVGTYMYTLYSGRCPLDPKPAEPDADWVAKKIGYETAWRVGRCQTRAPGFKVMPTAWNASNVTPIVSQTLDVRFILAPTSDVTVAVTTDGSYVGVASPLFMTFTPENYDQAQTVTVIGESGAAGSFPFNVTLVTSSDDEVYDGLSDSWDFLNTRTNGPVPAAVWITGNSHIITAGDSTPNLLDNTDFGVAYGMIDKTFVITNRSAATPVDLPGSPVTVTDPAGNFTLLQDAASGTLSAGGSTSFSIRYNPLSGGLHTGSVSVATSDPAVPVYTFAIKGYNPTGPSVDNTGSTAIDTTSAILSGRLSAGGYAKAWICWGENDGGTTSTGNWNNVVSLGQVSEAAAFSNTVSGLYVNATYFYRCYVSNAAGSAWSDEAVSFSGVPEVGTFEIPVTNGLVAHWDAMTITGLADGAQVSSWKNSANPGSYDLSRGGGSPKYRASVPGFKNKPAVEFAAGGGDWFKFTEIPNIRTVYWVLYDSYATANEQFLLGDNDSYDFHSGVDKFWCGYTHANIRNGTTEVNGVAVNGTLVNRPVDPAIVSLVTVGNVTASTVSSDRGGSRSWEGKIAEILIYDVPLSSNDENIVGGYLAAKYGLSTSYPDGVAAAVVVNTGARDITTSSAALNGSVDIAGTCAMYIHWGTNDGGKVAAEWDFSEAIGSLSDIVTNISYTIGGLTEGQRYYYTFRGSNDAGNVWASPSWTFIADGIADTNSVAVPTGLAALMVSTSQVALVWSDNSTNETGFLVQRSTTSGSGFTTVGLVTANVENYTDLTVNPGVTYYYRVAATNPAASSAPSAEVFAIVPKLTAQVTLSNLSQIYDGNPKEAAITTEPEGLSVSVTYNGSASAPTAVGSYEVVATVTETAYEGGTNGVLVINPGAPVVSCSGGVATGFNSARVAGQLTGGGVASTWICWGVDDAGAGSTGEWDKVVSLGQVTEGTNFSAEIGPLATNATYWYRCFASNGVGSAWSANAVSFSGEPSELWSSNTTVVSINFRKSTGETEMPAGDSAGAVLSSANWNNTDGANAGSEANIASPISAKLADSNGDETSLGITWSLGGTYATLNSGNADARMMSGYVDNTQTGSKTITVTNIIASSYSVYAYFGSDGNGRSGTIGIDGSYTYSFKTASAGKSYPADYVKTTDTGTNYPAANFAEWKHLSGNAFTLRHTKGSGNSGIHGIQIVNDVLSKIANLAPQGITEASANLNGSVNAEGTNYDVYVFWGTTDEGSNASLWDSSLQIGSYSNVATNVSYGASLDSGQLYYYTFMVSNASEVVWAAPSWTFRTPGELSPGPPVLSSDTGPAALTITSAELRGNMVSGSMATAWICWGDNDAGTDGTDDWDNAVLIGSVGRGMPFSTEVANLSTNKSYFYRCYATNAYGAAWSDDAMAFGGVPFAMTTGWAPTGLTSVVAWFDAADAGTVFLNGSTVSNWVDKSGHGNHAVQLSITNQPTYLASDPMAGNRPSIGDIRAAGKIGLTTPSMTVKTVYVVAYYKDGLAASFDGYPTLLSGPTANYGTYRIMGALNTANFIGTYNFNNNTYKNGSATSTPNGVLPMPAALFKFKANSAVTQVYGLGFNQGVADRDWQGYYCEWIFTDGTEDAATEQMIEGYLAHKWGLAGDLVSGHPYENERPGGNPFPIANLAPTVDSQTSATLNGELLAAATNYAAYVHWGTSDGGSNAAAWAYSSYLGAYSSTNTTLTKSLNDLIRGQTYYYTFRASNASGNVWASPSWQFAAPAGMLLTTNHLVPHAWIVDTATNVVIDYESEVMDDPDGDTFSTWEEYWCGTDPNNSNSYLKIDAVSFDGTNIQLQWSNAVVGAGVPDLVIEATTDLVTGTWTKVDQQRPVSGPNSWSNAASQKLYYRLAVPVVP